MTRRAHVLRAAMERRQRPRYAGWMSVTTGRPVGRREPAPDSAWTDAAAVAWSIAGLLAVYALAGWMPR